MSLVPKGGMSKDNPLTLKIREAVMEHLTCFEPGGNSDAVNEAQDFE